MTISIEFDDVQKLLVKELGWSCIACKKAQYQGPGCQ